MYSKQQARQNNVNIKPTKGLFGARKNDNELKEVNNDRNRQHQQSDKLIQRYLEQGIDLNG